MATNKIGIVGYGAYVPLQRIQSELIVREREGKREDLPEFLEKVKNGLLLRRQICRRYIRRLNHYRDGSCTERCRYGRRRSGRD